MFSVFAGIAQLEERQFSKLEAEGSKPFTCSNLKGRIAYIMRILLWRGIEAIVKVLAR